MSVSRQFGRAMAMAAAAATGLLSPARADVLLIKGSRCLAQVVEPDEPSPLEHRAATELSRYLGKIGGAQVAVVRESGSHDGPRILVGGTRAGRGIVAEPEARRQGGEGFIIRTRGNDVAIVGGGEYGTLYGAYELLEKYLGVRWYLPDPLGEVVPRRNVVALPEIDDAQKPAFEMRWVGSVDEWNLRNKMNRVSAAEYPPAFRVAPRIYHSQYELVAPKVYYAEHPEYFALVGGRRCGDRDAKLCYSNPDVARVVAENLAALKEADPSIALVSFSPSDGQKWCECEGCKAMDDKGELASDQRYSRRSLVFYNRVAEELEKRLPQQRLLVGAYNVYNRPPRDSSIRAHKNLAVIITHYDDYCMAHAVNDPACPRNAKYVELVRAWQRLIPDVYFYEYYHKGNWLDLPWPIVHCIASDIPYFRDIGARGLYTQYTTRNMWTNVLNYYVAAKLLWNPDADVPAIVDDFCRNFYGAAAQEMKAYYQTLERAMAGCGLHFPGNAFMYAKHVFTRRVLAEARRHLGRAKRLADSPQALARIEKAQASLDYASRFVEYQRLVESLAGISDALALRQQVERADQMAADLLRDLESSRYEGVAAGLRAAKYRALLTQGLEEYLQPARRRAAELGLVTEWMIIGPFDNRDMAGHARPYGPEHALRATYRGPSGPLRWREHRNPAWDGYIDLRRIVQPNEWVCAYALTYVTAPAPTQAQLRVGSNDSVVVWLDGKKVLDAKVERGAAMDDDVVQVRIPKGTVPLLVKVCQAEKSWGFYLRITGVDGNPLRTLRFSLRPGEGSN